MRQDVLPGELDPGGFPRRYQYLVGEGEGLLYVDGQGYDVRWERGRSADDLTTWTYADSGEPVVLPPGKVWWEIVPQAERDRARADALVGAVAFRRAGGEERVHRPPDLVVGVE